MPLAACRSRIAGGGRECDRSRSVATSIQEHIARLEAAVSPGHRPARRRELRHRLLAAEGLEADKLRLRLIALGEQDPHVWRAAALSLSRAADDALLHRAARKLLDGAEALAARLDPGLLAELRLDREGLVDGDSGGDEPGDDDLTALRVRAWQDELEEQAADLVAELRELTATVHGPDRREQSWDSYEYRGFRLEAWRVTVPFAALPYAARAVVPVAAAERLLALPDEGQVLVAGERPKPGRAYRRYWALDKRFLSLVAEIAARFLTDGGLRLAEELVARVRSLPHFEREAVELHCASLGLLEADVGALASKVLERASGEDFGARGELVLHALRRIDDLPPEERRALLAQALATARRTTTFVASNPFAACVEALARAEVSSVDELVELVQRAAHLKLRDWEGWERALHAGGRSLTALARAHGAEPVEQAVAALRGYVVSFPSIEALLLLAGARGLEHPTNVHYARRALDEARRLRPSVEGFRVEAAAARLLAELGAEGAREELRTLAARLRALPYGRAQQVGLQVAASSLAELDPGDGRTVAEALDLMARIRQGEPRWLACLGIATAPEARPEQVDEALGQAERATHRWLLRRPPLDVVVPLAMTLCARLIHGPRDPAVARLARLAAGSVSEELAGESFAVELMALGPLLATPTAVVAVADVLDQLGDTWWRLPLLALVADATALWLEHVAAAEAQPGAHREQPAPADRTP